MFAANLRFALRALRANRLRSALTMLGIIIGIAAVVVMVAVGAGARARVAAQIRSLGANLIGVTPGSLTMSGVRLGRGTAPQLDEGDAAAIAAEVPGVVVAAPVLYTRVQFTAGPANWQAMVRGVTPDFFIAREWGIADGREMTAEDQDRAAKVVLIGTTLRDKLFEGADPVGAVLRIRDAPFTVAGVLDRKGQDVHGEDQDDTAFVPLSTARRQLIGVNRASPRLVHGVFVKYAEGTSADATMEAMTDLLRQRHRLAPGRDDSFILRNLAEVAGAETAATRVLSNLLAAVASVSLVVGGIGIMNITLVSVTERTREIGLRLAVGARGRDILAQFLVEAVMLAVLGGCLGVLAGIAGALAAAAIAGWPVVIDLGSVVLAVAVAAAVGVFFGFYPARRAARLDPIAALRFE
jgi:putative ABC transport system permease protein